MKKIIDIQSLIRENIRQLIPYSSARNEFKGKAEIFLDANESPYPSFSPVGKAGEQLSLLNRYPDPMQRRLKAAIGEKMELETGELFLGNGSDEAIDLLFRAFCEPGKDIVLICSPTYGMYAVSAGINGVELVDVPLTAGFQPDISTIKEAILRFKPKLIFLCSPNNPTGNAMDRIAVESILESANGLVVVDEAYADFAPEKSFLKDIKDWSNLVVLRTFSKAYGLAGIRLGMAVANSEIIDTMNKIKPPYNLSSLVQEVALERVMGDGPEDKIAEMISERNRLQDALIQMEGVIEVFPSDANFLLVRFKDAAKVFLKLREKGIIVRDRRSHVADALRITVGTPVENQSLLYQVESIFIPNFSIH